MSYLVLARRWRPKKFSEIVGQPHVVKTLLNGLRQKRLAHAYLFSGPRGVGKTTVARLIARAINCADPQDGEPCGVCKPCRDIADGRFIDTFEIDAASNTGVEDVRKLRDDVRYAPIEGEAKVYIIDEVHMLSTAAFNALLKTLEEPPEHVYFCLATTEAQKVPATILSRCQRFDFRRVQSAEIRTHLEHICKTDDIRFELEALDLVARRADGSVRDSLSVLDQVLAFTGGSITREEAVEVVGEIRHDLYTRAIALVQSQDPADAFRLDEELAAVGTDPQDFLIGLENHLVQILQVQSLGIDNVDVPPEMKDEFKMAADDLKESDIVRLLQLCSVAETDVRRNYNPRIRLQLLLLRFAMFERSVVLTDLISRIGDERQGGQTRKTTPKTSPARSIPNRQTRHDGHANSGKASSSVSAPSQASVTQKVPPADDPLGVARAKWAEICRKVAEEHNSRGRMIQFGGYPAEYSNGKLKVNFADSSSLELARNCLATLKQAVGSVVGDVELDLVSGPIPTPEPELEPEESDPAVRMLMDRLDARVVNSPGMQ